MEASKGSNEAFLARLFILMAENKRYKPLKDQLDSYQAIVVEAKRLLADYILLERSGGSNVKRESNGAGVAFTASSRGGHKKTVQCYGCGKTEHYLPECTKTSAKKMVELLAIVNSRDFKATKRRVVNTAVEEGGKDPDGPPDDTDVQEYVDFLGQDHFNLGKCKDEPNEDDPFGLSISSLGLAQFELGFKLADVKSGLGNQMAFEW